MANLTRHVVDRSRRAFGFVRASRATQVCLFSAALVAVCGSDFAPPMHTALAAPAATATSTLSPMCARTVPMRRSLWDTGTTDTGARLADPLPAGAMPTHLCVEYFHDLPGINRQVKIPRPPPAPKKVAVKPTYKPASQHTSSGGGGGGGGGGFIAGGEPCTASRSIVWTIAISQWAVPPGCFGGIYTVNPYSYGVETADYGWCDWWPKAIKHNNGALNGARHGSPIVGAVMWFNAGDQGAGSAGHWAYVESIGPNGWLLISEMNDTWRGGGWAKINYRYVRVDGGTSFIY